MFVPFEDIVTTDIVKGTNIVRNLSNALSGTTIQNNGSNKSEENSSNNNNQNEYFETATSKDDLECIWYHTAKNEWTRQQEIIGDYIPPYTAKQKDMMVQHLTMLANEIIQENKDLSDTPDLVLASLLHRYIHQIENYMTVDDL